LFARVPLAAIPPATLSVIRAAAAVRFVVSPRDAPPLRLLARDEASQRPARVLPGEPRQL
jgi:hypothetical protein